MSFQDKPPVDRDPAAQDGGASMQRAPSFRRACARVIIAFAGLLSLAALVAAGAPDVDEEALDPGPTASMADGPKAE